MKNKRKQKEIKREKETERNEGNKTKLSLGNAMRKTEN